MSELRLQNGLSRPIMWGSRAVPNRVRDEPPVARIRDAHTILAPLTLAVVGLAACASAPYKPREVPFPEVAVGSPHPHGLIFSYDDALTSVLWIMENDLGFPPITGSLRLYNDRIGLEAGLVGEGYDASYARQICGRLDGITRPGIILANDSKLRWDRWPARIAFLAHEVTHVAEYALANGRRGSSDQWLREGLAEWVSWRVVESLRVGTLADRRRSALVHLREAGANHELPSFSHLVAQSAWLREGNRRTADPMYDQAFLAADQLIARHGLPAVLDYFRLFASSDDNLENFHTAFKEERARFEADFQRNLDRLLD
jgi:hypothetical protein